ncbi:MAG: hypothetical protein SFT68_02405 [Rickettsiaceae bacterium]|nr:hypothetical protein [Rickettsiaceae bacterium]
MTRVGRRRESSLTISWIPSFEGMTRERGLSFPGFFVIPKLRRESSPPSPGFHFQRDGKIH